MSLSNVEFAAIVADDTKTIAGDIAWSEDEDHSPSVEFKVSVESDAGWPIFVKGSYNQRIPALSYTLIHQGSGRIYALDIGKDHHNPSCDRVGEKHKHRWREDLRDKEAYVPNDITSDATDPVLVWRQFCAEAKVTHGGHLQDPRPTQGMLTL